MNRLKLSLGDRVSAAVSRLAEAEEIGEQEVVRRALALYLDSNLGPGWALGGPPMGHDGERRPTECTVEAGSDGPWVGPVWATNGPFENERADGVEAVDALGGTLKEEGGDPSPTSPLPLPSVSQDSKTNPTGESEGGPGGFVYPAEFLEFWTAYPKKHSKGDAFRAWKALGAKRPPLPEILAAIARQRLTEQWQRDGGQFIPYPATWLRGHRWADDGTTLPTPAAGLRRETNVAVLRQRAERELFGRVPDGQLAAAQEELDAAGSAEEINRVLTKWLIEARRKGPA